MSRKNDMASEVDIYRKTKKREKKKRSTHLIKKGRSLELMGKKICMREKR